jgi:hypothetical protein
MTLKGRDTMCTGSHPFIPAENTVRLEMIYLLNGQRVENVLHLQTDGPVSGGDVNNLVNSVEDIYLATLAVDQAEAAQLVLLRVTDVSVEDSFQREVEPSVDAHGALAQLPTPGGTTVATKFTGGMTGRSKRGRAFWIGLTEPQVEGNHLATGVSAAITSAWTLFFAALTTVGDGFIHVIVSYCGDGDWRTEALITPVSDYSTEENIDSQRRRLTGRGL